MGTRRPSTTTSSKKCLPQVEEITSEYGPIEIVWFDTPGKMPKKYVEQLVEVVRKNQPHALVSGRAGHGLGDYQTLGDMEVPRHNIEGMWESVDTTNDSWAYAWYDEYWKSPKEILAPPDRLRRTWRNLHAEHRSARRRLRAASGPPDRCAKPASGSVAIRRSSTRTDASPWQHALPWGDVTSQGQQALPGRVRLARLRQALSAGPEDADCLGPLAQGRPI